jgi:signal transduction histidine kinase
LWYRQTHPADRDRVSIKFARACATGEPFRDVIRVIARNGEVLWVNAEARLVRDADGEPLFLQGVGFDVTDQHRAQEIREELIREQAERAEQDRQREKKDQFLAAAAHDLKTPITAIKGLVQILERRMSRESDPVPEYVRSALPQVRKAADNVTKLVNQLLDVSRMDAGNPLSLNREVVDLVQLVSQVIDDHRSISDIHRLVFRSQCTAVMANIDAPRIERVVSNLLTNAIKYSPKGGQVTVRLNREDVGGCPEATIEVQDQGVGIPTADLPRIFERFHRGSNVQAHLSGTGIGLAYVQQVVSDHGGTIAVQSRESEGSRFTIHLPLEPGADA